jgi:hypothetical protein
MDFVLQTPTLTVTLPGIIKAQGYPARYALLVRLTMAFAAYLPWVETRAASVGMNAAKVVVLRRECADRVVYCELFLVLGLFHDALVNATGRGVYAPVKLGEDPLGTLRAIAAFIAAA